MSKQGVQRSFIPRFVQKLPFAVEYERLAEHIVLWTAWRSDLPHRRVEPEEMPAGRNVVQFHFSDSSGPHDTYWMVADKKAGVDLCNHDPKLDSDLFVECEVGVLTGIYMGRRNLERDIENGKIFLSGDTRLRRNFNKWLPPSVYADVDGIASVSD